MMDHITASGGDREINLAVLGFNILSILIGFRGFAFIAFFIPLLIGVLSRVSIKTILFI